MRIYDLEVVQDREISYRLDTQGFSLREMIRDARITELDVTDNGLIGYYPLNESKDSVYRAAIESILETEIENERKLPHADQNGVGEYLDALYDYEKQKGSQG